MSTNPAPLITLLSTGIAHCALYFSGHPRVRASAQSFVKELDRLLDASGHESLFLGVVDGQLVHEGRSYLGPTAIAKRVVDLMGGLCCGGILFRRGVEAREVLQLFELASRLEQPAQDLELARTQLHARDMEHLELSSTYGEPDWLGEHHVAGVEFWRTGHADDLELETMVPVYQAMFETVEVAHGRAAADHEIDVDGARGVGEQLVGAVETGLDRILRLARYPDYDSYTIGHSVRVALFAVMAGRAAGLPRELLVELGTAGLLHDVGKSKVADEILYKPGRLTDEERREMSLHAGMGAEILIENRHAGALAVGCAFGHHLRPDGRGYPELRPWVRTGPLTHLMRVCDAFEAMTAVRPYKPAVTPRRAFELLLADRGGCDPNATQALFGATGFYPPGRRVLLTSGERALVRAVGTDPALPRVVLTHDCAGQEIPLDMRPEVDLAGFDSKGRAVVELFRDSDVPEHVPAAEHAHAHAQDPAHDSDLGGCC